MNNLKITIIQSNLYWENRNENLKMFSQKIAAIKEQTDLIVLPEMFTTGFSMKPEELFDTMDGETIQWMKQEAAKKKCVITGSFICEENGSYYNRLIWMKSDGSYEKYDKRHLFRMAEEDKHYSAGEKKMIVELNGWKICPLICYDLRFPVWSRNKNIPLQPHNLSHPTTSTGSVQASKGNNYEYDLLIYVANWPERRAHPWKTLLLARAIENQCYVVGLNRVGEDGNQIAYSGDSVVINAKGEIISTTKANEETIETIEINFNELTEFRKQFPVFLDADEFNLTPTLSPSTSSGQAEEGERI